MTDRDAHSRIAALQALQESLDLHRRERSCGLSSEIPEAGAPGGKARPKPRSRLRRLHRFFRRPLVRRVLYGIGGTAAVTALVCAGLMWRLSRGPIELDIATPWLAAAIEENFGGRHKVEVGGTQIERDEGGRTAVRLRDIIVRDADGAIVASAPRAEVGVSGSSLLMGQIRAQRLLLVGAELAIRIETDGQITISTGAERRPLAITPAIVKPAPDGTSAQPGQAVSPQTGPQQGASLAPNGAAALSGSEAFAALLAWIDRLGDLAIEAQDLREIGLKSGNLTVDDLRTGKQWSFEKINLSVTRPRRGGIVVSLGSESVERPWLLTAAVSPAERGRRMIQIEARKVSTKDILLALRVDEGKIEADVPISAVIRAEIGFDGTPLLIDGRVIADAGTIGDMENPSASFEIDKAELSLDWDATRRSLVAPFQILSGGNRFTLLAQLEAPREPSTAWGLSLTGGTIVLGPSAPAGAAVPVSSTTTPSESVPLVLNRILLRAKLDPVKKRIDLEQGDIGNADLRFALSGSVDFSGEPRLTAGLAGTAMPVSAMKRVWPIFIASKVRAWVMDNVQSGHAERLLVAANAPIETLKESGPPIPEDGLSVEVVTNGTSVQPVTGLPAIRDADLTTRITGRTANVTIGRGTVELPSGRKLSVTGGLFEIPDFFPKGPATRTRFRIDGPVPAAAELLAMDRLRDSSGISVDPATSRGNVSGQVTVALPLKADLPKGTAQYTVNVDLTNFAAEKMVMGQKVESPLLKVTANNQGYQIKGDVKINGTAAALDYRKGVNEVDAEVRVQATLDEASRSRLGFDLGPMVSGSVPIRLGGRLAGDRDGRFSVEADLTLAKIDNLLPGWIKLPGRQSRATFTLVNKAQSTRFEDLVIEGPGVQVKGALEIDEKGDLIAAQFPVFSMSDGDKTNLKVDRANDGALRVVMRGDVYDGRNFVKTALAGTPDQKAKRTPDLDLDIRLGAVAGFNGETVRGLELKLSRRGGNIRSLALNAKLGRDTPLIGDLRRTGNRQVIYMETNDAGALFRLVDSYPKMIGGQMWIAMDPPNDDQTPQEGLFNIRDFSVRGEAALNNVVSSAPGGARSGVDFSVMRVEFTRSPGKLNIRDGVVRGPTIGATIDGQIDYTRNDVRMRGTFVPLYGLNNAFGQLPILGLFLGGSNEGLLGITYEVVGPPNGPTLRVNPISAVAPGLLRKFFEFPAANGRLPAEPAQR